MSRLAAETIRELMAAAADDKTLCPGMVTFIQAFGAKVNPHPHLHALVSRGGSDPLRRVDPGSIRGPQGRPYSVTRCPRFLRREEVISQERLELLLSWRHSGFSVHNEVRLPAGDTKALEVLVPGFGT